jgi:hypothetical protein
MEMMQVMSKDLADEGKENQAPQESRKVTKEETPTHLQETPSKRGKLGNLLQGIFGGGGQSQLSSSKTRSNSAASAKNWLTTSKAPDRPPSTDTQLNDQHSSGTLDIDTAEQVIASEEVAITSAGLSSSTTLPAQVDGSVTGDIVPVGTSQQPPLGLGISSIVTEQSTQSGCGSKKKKKPKKKKSNSAADELQITTEFSPEVKHEDISEVFRFGDGSSSPQLTTIPHIATSPQAVTQGDDQLSNASSQTIGPDTPSSEVPSPQSSRKLPPRPPGSGHLMEAKQPIWKQKRRVLSRSQHDVSADTNPDGEPEEEPTLQVFDLRDKNDQGPTQRIVGPQRDRLFVYVGAPVRDEIEDGLEVEQSREKLQKLAMEELRRKRNTSKFKLTATI